MLNKEKRGLYHFLFDENGEILNLRRHDNNWFIIGTNIELVLFRDGTSLKKEKVSQPCAVNYTKYMGGVNHHDRLISKYFITGKK